MVFTGSPADFSNFEFCAPLFTRLGHAQFYSLNLTANILARLIWLKVCPKVVTDLISVSSQLLSKSHSGPA